MIDTGQRLEIEGSPSKHISLGLLSARIGKAVRAKRHLIIDLDEIEP